MKNKLKKVITLFLALLFINNIFVSNVYANDDIYLYNESKYVSHPIISEDGQRTTGLCAHRLEASFKQVGLVLVFLYANTCISNSTCNQGFPFDLKGTVYLKVDKVIKQVYTRSTLVFPGMYSQEKVNVGAYYIPNSFATDFSVSVDMQPIMSFNNVDIK